MNCMKKLRFSSRPRAKVRRQGSPGPARAQPWQYSANVLKRAKRTTISEPAPVCFLIFFYWTTFHHHLGAWNRLIFFRGLHFRVFVVFVFEFLGASSLRLGCFVFDRCFVFEIRVLRFREFWLGCFVFEFWVLCFQDLGASCFGLRFRNYQIR